MGTAVSAALSPSTTAPIAVLRCDAVRVTIGTLLAATLLTLSIGLQVLEATGRWDRTLQDTGDEAIIVTVVLCIGAALVVARVVRPRLSLSPVAGPVVTLRTTNRQAIAPAGWFLLGAGPPLSLRI